MGQALKPLPIEPNPRFIGRTHEIARLRQIAAEGEAAIVVVHGRRRVGKTELAEQVFRERNLLKFEGVEGQDETAQRRLFMRQLAKYAGDPAIAALDFGTWLEVFEYLARFVATGAWTLFFEELQWLCNYHDTLVSELKHVWDNQFRRNDKLLLILCGSAPSFMVGKVLKSKALYNRSMHELPLAEFSLGETREFFGANRSRQEIMDAYLTVGGIPEYLKYLRRESSVFLSLCHNTFVSGAFFSAERDRVFVSSLARNAHCGEIVDFLSHRRFATRPEIAAHLKIDPGGTLSALLGFGAVAYSSGVFYSRATQAEDSGYQLDLVFKRNDRVYTICEIKYLRGPAPRDSGYFDRIVTLDDIFGLEPALTKSKAWESDPQSTDVMASLWARLIYNSRPRTCLPDCPTA